MTVRWSQTALHDLDSLHDFVSEDRPSAAVDMVERILSGIDALSRHPEMGRKGRVVGTRELIITPYVVAYRVRNDVAELIAIIHSARRWPGSF
ncbi:MAG TPA: type II toxin-antitoxin system RelE/ParE family toxin [Bryobacteraceae bacterium]|nr:type II toxin-antitoxin system RelE/ParE family toxin [Bryobacteraceae bacterium]